MLFGGQSTDLLPTASDKTRSLFEGVYVRRHSDPQVGGLKLGETKSIRAKLCVLKSDAQSLPARDRRDFPAGQLQAGCTAKRGQLDARLAATAPQNNL